MLDNVLHIGIAQYRTSIFSGESGLRKRRQVTAVDQSAVEQVTDNNSLHDPAVIAY